MRPLQTLVINNQPSNASITSGPIDLRQIVCFSLQASATPGSASGTFQLQVSNTPCLQTFSRYDTTDNPAIWTNVGTALTFAQASVASSQLIPKMDSSYVALRVVFTDGSSGSNTSRITAALAALGV